MKIMAAKQKEIMLKYGLQADQNEQEEGQILGTLDLMRAFSVPTAEGNKNVSIRMGELVAKQNIQNQNIKNLKQALLNYKSKVKLSNAQNLIAAQMLPGLEEGEEIWPTPSDLEQVPVD